MNCIIMGDEIGLDVLLQIAKCIDLNIGGYASSKGKVIGESLTKSLESIPRIDNPNDFDVINFVKRENIEFVLVHSYNRILSSEFLSIPNVRYVNIHGGKLPEYRGANVLNWAILNGELEIGISIHEIVPEIDAGPLIGHWTLEIDKSDTAVTLLNKMINSIIIHAPSILSDYLAGKVIAIPQKDAKMGLWRRRTPEDGIFDWNWKSVDIYNLIRALVKPWPGARYIDRQGQLIILEQKMELEDIEKLRKIQCEQSGE